MSLKYIKTFEEVSTEFIAKALIKSVIHRYERKYKGEYRKIEYFDKKLKDRIGEVLQDTAFYTCLYYSQKVKMYFPVILDVIPLYRFITYDFNVDDLYLEKGTFGVKLDNVGIGMDSVEKILKVAKELKSDTKYKKPEDLEPRFRILTGGEAERLKEAESVL